MIKIRNGCFETNSSSVHTLVISRNMPKVLPPSITFHIKEYGWEIKAYDDMQDRADYFYTAACSICGYDVRGEVKEKLIPYGVQVDFSYYDSPSFSIYEKSHYWFIDRWVDCLFLRKDALQEFFAIGKLFEQENHACQL